MKKKRRVLVKNGQQLIPFWEDIYDINEIASRNNFISDKEVHVWQASLDCIADFYNYLSIEEKLKAGRFRNQRDKQRFITSHGILRCILGAYIQSDPSSLKFERTKYGKPWISSYNFEISIRFNMTHSEDIVCFIISKSNDVGIDIEKIKYDFDWDSIAELYFSPKEVTDLQVLPRKERIKLFFTLWTRKEALLKALGTGLSDLENIKGIENDYMKRNYPLFSFSIGENYQGALAVNNEISKIRYFRFLS